MFETVTSAANPFVSRMRGLNDKRERVQTQLLLAEGPKLVAEALAEGLCPSAALVSQEKAEQLQRLVDALAKAGCAIRLCSENVLRAVSETRTPQGICAAFGWPRALELENAPHLLVAMDGVQDPGNVGGIWRTADAAGFGGILFSDGCADATAPKVIRSAMGSAFRVPARICESFHGELALLREQGYDIIVTALDGDDFFAATQSRSEKLVLVIGSEGHGVRAETKALSTKTLRLPMSGGAESLNANVAAGIMLYALGYRLHP